MKSSKMHKFVLIIILFFVNLSLVKAQPRIKSVMPNKITAGQQKDVTIYCGGTHFKQASYIYIIWEYGDFQVLSEPFTSDSVLIVTVNPFVDIQEGDYYVQIYSDSDPILYLSDAIHVNPAPLGKIVSINPSFITSTNTKKITMKGSRTHFTKNMALGTSIRNSYCTIDNVFNDSTLIFSLYLPDNLYSDVYILFAYEQLGRHYELYNKLRVDVGTKPTIQIVGIDSAEAGDSSQISIKGTNTKVKYQLDQKDCKETYL